MSYYKQEYLDFWYYEIGVNVIPADTKNKTTNTTWSVYQNDAISCAHFDDWKKDRAYINGGHNPWQNS
ncbi:MAG: hypothetical protein P0116_17110 [Candidatus Nitrosocosmicus sp.]|nr:hypothetical protein [Candidatus Nitrosocosmicus sp.]